MRNFVREFKEFIATSNMIELAVAVILAGAVGAVITSFTNGIMMQVVAAVFGQPDFGNITITLRENVDTVIDPATGRETSVDSVLQIGAFINTLIVLVLTALVLFVIIKAYNRVKKPQEVVVVGPTEADLLAEIRDLLASRQL